MIKDEVNNNDDFFFEKKQCDFLCSQAVRAHELDPTDATPLFLLGNWCYEVAGIGWMVSKSIFFFFFRKKNAFFFNHSL